MKYSSLIIGHVTMDKNTDHLGNTVEGAGGAVLYSSAAAFALGHNVAVLTKVKPGDSRISAFTVPETNIYCLPAENNTDMVNIYYTADKERRKSVCASQGDQIAASDIPEGVEADIYHLAGLVAGDYDKNIIKDLAAKGKVAVDVQGYLRHVDRANGGQMFFLRTGKRKKNFSPTSPF